MPEKLPSTDQKISDFKNNNNEQGFSDNQLLKKSEEMHVSRDFEDMGPNELDRIEREEGEYIQNKSLVAGIERFFKNRFRQR